MFFAFLIFTFCYEEICLDLIQSNLCSSNSSSFNNSDAFIAKLKKTFDPCNITIFNNESSAVTIDLSFTSSNFLVTSSPDFPAFIILKQSDPLISFDCILTVINSHITFSNSMSYAFEQLININSSFAFEQSIIVKTIANFSQVSSFSASNQNLKFFADKLLLSNISNPDIFKVFQSISVPSINVSYSNMNFPNNSIESSLHIYLFYSFLNTDDFIPTVSFEAIDGNDLIFVELTMVYLGDALPYDDSINPIYISDKTKVLECQKTSSHIEFSVSTESTVSELRIPSNLIEFDSSSNSLYFRLKDKPSYLNLKIYTYDTNVPETNPYIHIVQQKEVKDFSISPITQTIYFFIQDSFHEDEFIDFSNPSFLSHSNIYIEFNSSVPHTNINIKFIPNESKNSIRDVSFCSEFNIGFKSSDPPNIKCYFHTIILFANVTFLGNISQSASFKKVILLVDYSLFSSFQAFLSQLDVNNFGIIFHDDQESNRIHFSSNNITIGNDTLSIGYSIASNFIIVDKKNDHLIVDAEDDLPDPLPVIRYGTIPMISGLDSNLDIEFRSNFSKEVISLFGDGKLILNTTLTGNFLPLKISSMDIQLTIFSCSASEIQISDLKIHMFQCKSISQSSLHISSLILDSSFTSFSSDVHVYVDSLSTSDPLKQLISFINNVFVKNESSIDLIGNVNIEGGDFSKVTFNVQEVFNLGHFSSLITFGSKYIQVESLKQLYVTVDVSPTEQRSIPSDFKFFIGKWEGNILDRIHLLTDKFSVEDKMYNVSLKAIDNSVHLIIMQEDTTMTSSNKHGGLKRSELILIIALSSGVLGIIIVILAIFVGRKKSQMDDENSTTQSALTTSLLVQEEAVQDFNV